MDNSGIPYKCTLENHTNTISNVKSFDTFLYKNINTEPSYRSSSKSIHENNLEIIEYHNTQLEQSLFKHNQIINLNKEIIELLKNVINNSSIFLEDERDSHAS